MIFPCAGLDDGLRLHRILGRVDDLDGLGECAGSTVGSDLNLDDRVGDVLGIGIVRHKEGHVEGET